MSDNNAFNILKYIIEDDTGLIYGETGTGKSQIVTAIARQAVELDKKVAICDTEGNYSGNVKEFFTKNTDYHKTPDFDKVMDWFSGLKAGYDLIILDSFGAPVLGEYALASLRERGDMLLKGEALAYTIKKYAQANGCMAIITNQPVSAMGKARDFKTGALRDPLAPFGGKANYYWKEAIRTDKTSEGLISEFTLTTYKSRHMPTAYKLATFRVSNTGIKFVFSSYSGTKGGDLPPITVETQGNGETHPPSNRKSKSKKEPKIEPPVDDKEPETGDPVDMDELRNDLKGLMNTGNVDAGIFTALAYGADLGTDIETPQDLKDVDSINLMIEKVTEHIEKHKDEHPEQLL